MMSCEKITAVYCRVAHADQWALDCQRDMLVKYALEHGYENIRSYLDNGFSG